MAGNGLQFIMHTSGRNKTELIQEGRSLNMLLDVNNAIRNKNPLNVVLRNCLSIMCVGLQYPVGHIFFFNDKNTEFLTPSDVWFIKDPNKTPAIHACTMKTRFRYSEDIAGRALSSGEPCLIEDVSHDKNFLRKEACQLDQLHGAMAFPVYLDERVIFVVEFFSHEYQKYDNSLLLLLNRLSAQISRSIVDRNNIDKLRKSMNQLKYALGSGKVGVWEYDPKTQAVSWDEQMYLMYGIVPHEFGGTYTSWEETLHPDDRERAANEFKNTLISKHKFDADFRIITPTGDVRYIHANAMVKRSIDGVAESVFGINVDITKEKTLLLDLSKKSKEMEIMTESLKKHAYFDSLTGLMNRFFLEENVGRDLMRCDRTKSRLAVLFIDLDDFKKINDSLGHNIGDQVLFEIASRLKHVVRRDDIVGRIGGDEFIAVLEVKPSFSGACMIHKILKALNRPLQLDNDQTVQVSASIGIAYYPDHGSVFSELMNHADAALLKAKSSGKNQAIYFGSLTSQTH